MKILIVDDHVLIREALRGVLEQLAPDATLLEAWDGAGAMGRLSDDDIDLVLLDLRLPDRSGFDVLNDVRRSHPQTSIVVLSESDRRDDIAMALEAGALGYIPKSSSRAVMLGALELVFAGGIYIPPQILADAGEGTPGARSAPLERSGLSRRQLQVLELMMQGKSNKAICRDLGVAEPTVKNHVTAILKALNASNRTEAVITAGALGIQPRRS